MENVKRYSSFIKRIITTPRPIRQKLLKTSNPNIIKAISEIIYNIIHKNISVSAATLKKLTKFRKVFYKLINKRNSSWLVRKKILIDNLDCLEALSALFK